MQRRSFLKGSAASAAVAFTGRIASATPATIPLAKGPGNKWEGRVVINFNKNSVTGVGADQAVVSKMVDDSIMLLTGESSVGAAWKAVFPPSLSASSKIAIKINIMNYGLTCSNPCLVRAMCDGLLQMDFNGAKLPARNITVFDLHYYSSDSAGFTQALFSDVNLIKDTRAVFSDGANGKQYATAVNAADFLINVPSMRGHEAWVGKVTLGFKSHYGTYDPYPHTGSPTYDAAVGFDPAGDGPQEYLRDINCTGVVYNKSVLTVCSALFGQYESVGPHGGPQDYSRYVKTVDSTAATGYPCTILMSTDPVSVEVQSIKIMRLTQNPAGATSTASMPAYLKASAGIEGALADGTVHNIGIIDESLMDVRRIINDTPVKRPQTRRSASGTAITASHVAGSRTAFIEYRLPSSHRGQVAGIRVHREDGSLVHESQHEATGSVNHTSWDETTAAGVRVAPGRYLVQLQAGPARTSCVLAIPR